MLALETVPLHLFHFFGKVQLVCQHFLSFDSVNLSGTSYYYYQTFVLLLLFLFNLLILLFYYLNLYFVSLSTDDFYLKQDMLMKKVDVSEKIRFLFP